MRATHRLAPRPELAREGADGVIGRSRRETLTKVGKVARRVAADAVVHQNSGRWAIISPARGTFPHQPRPRLFDLVAHSSKVGRHFNLPPSAFWLISAINWHRRTRQRPGANPHTTSDLRWAPTPVAADPQPRGTNDEGVTSCHRAVARVFGGLGANGGIDHDRAGHKGSRRGHRLGRQPHDDGPPQQRRREHYVHDDAHAVADLSLSGAADHA